MALPPWQRFLVRVPRETAPLATSLQLQDAAPSAVAAENHEIVPTIRERDATKLAKNVDRLLGAERLSVDDVDEIGLFSGHKHPLPATDR